MKKNGFTLPELLGVITLLALLALLIIPNISKNVANSKQKLYQAQIENFKKAASDWMAIHTLEIPDENIDASITLGCLKNEGLLETSIVNPKTGLQFPNDMIVTIKSGSNQYIYTVDEKSGSDESVELPTGKCHFQNGRIEE